jgi:hypothetical protein
MKPIQEPIIGKEELGDLSQPQQALAQFYKAFNSRDLKMIDENFAASDEAPSITRSGASAEARSFRIRCTRSSSRAPRTFMSSFGTTPSIVLATCSGLSGGNEGRIMTVIP